MPHTLWTGGLASVNMLKVAIAVMSSLFLVGGGTA